MKLFYKKSGEGRPLIILHGLMGMLDNWQTPAKTLEKHYEVFLLDLRNHGHSPHSDVFTYEAMMNDLLKFIEEQQLDNIFLMGHSMGGKVAMKFAQNYPELVKKLIIVDIAPKKYEIEHQDILSGLLAVDLENIQSRKDAEEVLTSYVPDAGVRQFLLKNLYWKEKGQLAWRFNLKVINDQISNVGEEINDRMYEGPTMFIKGEKSDYITDADFEMIKAYFPDAQIKTIKKAGHWVHAENPEDFLKNTIAFLEEKN